MKETCEKCGAINDTLEICNCQKLAENKERKYSILGYIFTFCIIICIGFVYCIFN